MGIQISNPDVMPSITYDKIHVTKLDISQPTFDDDTLQPKYQVTISYRHYGVVDGVRHYKKEDAQRVYIEDFLTVAATDAAAGDMTLLNAMSGIELAIANIISDQRGVTTTVV